MEEVDLEVFEEWFRKYCNNGEPEWSFPSEALVMVNEEEGVKMNFYPYHPNRTLFWNDGSLQFTVRRVVVFFEDEAYNLKLEGGNDILFDGIPDDVGTELQRRISQYY